jgi:hypothetical protein
MQLLGVTLLALMFSVAVVHGQITLNADRNPVPGDRVVRFAIDTTGVLEGPAGANRSWDFSTLVATGDSQVVSYLDPAATPYASTFPAATVAAEFQDSGAGVFMYYVTSPTHIASLGLATEELAIAYSNAEVLLTYPFTYNSQFSDVAYAAYDLDSLIHIEQNITISVHADAYGMLAVPNAVMNALRVKIVQERVDSAYFMGFPMFVMISRSTSYEWYSAQHKFPVLGVSHIETSVNGIVSRSKVVSLIGSPGTTDVEERAEVPQSMLLEQNFPNPFNPSTTIRYFLPDAGKVSLEVFNVVGQKVATVVDNEYRPAGSHEATFAAFDLPSGVYLYRLSAGPQVETRKFTLVK